MIPADSLSSTSSPASAEAIPCRCPGSGASCNARWRISVEHHAGAWDIRRHVEHCRGVEHPTKRGTSRCAPGAFSLTAPVSRSPRAQKGAWCARRVNLCQSTTATVRPALLHWNFEAAHRTASVGVFARLRVIPKTCILHLNFSTSREQSDDCPET